MKSTSYWPLAFGSWHLLRGCLWGEGERPLSALFGDLQPWVPQYIALLRFRIMGLRPASLTEPIYLLNQHVQEGELLWFCATLRSVQGSWARLGPFWMSFGSTSFSLQIELLVLYLSGSQILMYRKTLGDLAKGTSLGWGPRVCILTSCWCHTLRSKSLSALKDLFPMVSFIYLSNCYC